MSPDSVFWLERVWYTLPAISVKVRQSPVKIPGDYHGITVLDRVRDGASPSEGECAGRRLTNTECSVRRSSYCSE